MNRWTSSTPPEQTPAHARLLLARATDCLDWSLVADFMELPWPTDHDTLAGALAQIAAEEVLARSRHLANPLAEPIAVAPMAHVWLVADAVFTALCPAWRPALSPLSEQAHETRRGALVLLQAEVQPLRVPVDGCLHQQVAPLITALGAMQDRGATQGDALVRTVARAHARQTGAATATPRARSGSPTAEAAT
jgi:hypothetical protein